MDCAQAHQLFDAHLDGELSPALATELGAHLLHCPKCRQALALMEVSTHIIASDREPARLSAGFQDRLLTCIDQRPRSLFARTRRLVYVAVPLAAAAVVALAFLGVFDREGQVAGERGAAQDPPPLGEGVAQTDPTVIPEGDAENLLLVPDASADLNGASPGGQALARWVRQWQDNLDVTRNSGDAIKQGVDQTIIQLLESLRNAQDAGAGLDHFPGSETTPALGTDDPGDEADEDIEDL